MAGSKMGMTTSSPKRLEGLNELHLLESLPLRATEPKFIESGIEPTRALSRSPRSAVVLRPRSSSTDVSIVSSNLSGKGGIQKNQNTFLLSTRERRTSLNF
jgi:hypothetical protein